ncbi:MAG: protein phosphatase 2C domain-containing protein [Lachnospiraceae bacterium]|nr:protein phosphatase 2C domain-containing protein [Lachnospiraceae bacterium]
MNDESRFIKTAYAIQQGEIHQYYDRPCQDVIRVERNSRMVVMALSDGAGSCERSLYAAKASVDWICEYMLTDFEMTYNGAIKDEAALVRMLASESRDVFLHLNIPFEECCCTLIMVAVHSDGRWLAIHIGDGVIIKQEDKSEILSLPENGKEPNATYFLNGSHAEEHLRVYVGRLHGKGGFLITSDGMSCMLANSKTGQIAEAVDVMLNWVRNYPEEEVNESLKWDMEEVFGKQNNDDMSIGLLWYEGEENGCEVA